MVHWGWEHISQEAGLKVKEYELIRKNFSATGNFGKDLLVLSMFSVQRLLTAFIP